MWTTPTTIFVFAKALYERPFDKVASLRCCDVRVTTSIGPPEAELSVHMRPGRATSLLRGKGQVELLPNTLSNPEKVAVRWNRRVVSAATGAST